MNQNVRFQEGIYALKKFHLIIIGTNMHNIYDSYLDHYSKTDSSDFRRTYCFHQEG